MLNPVLEQFNRTIRDFGVSCTINGTTSSTCFFKEIPDNNENDSKYIFMPLYSVNQGDNIDALGEKWLLMSKGMNTNEVYEKGIVKLSNHNTIFNFSGNIKTFPTCIETKVLDIESNKYMSMVSGKINVKLQDNVDARDIVIGQRFIYSGNAWVVDGIDKSIIGIITLNCSLSLKNSDDDIENEIADRWKYEVVHSYTLSITNGETSNVSINTDYRILAEVKDNGIVVSNPSLTFLSSDSNVATVDNSGNILGVSVGTVIITAQMTYSPTIKDTIEITVVEESVPDLFTVSVSGSATLKLNQTLSYVGKVFNNGIEVFDKSLVWTIRNQDGTTTNYINITTQTGSGCSCKAVNLSANVNKYSVLKATLSDDANVYYEFVIQVKSIF